MDIITRIIEIDQNAQHKLAQAYSQKKAIILEAEGQEYCIRDQLLGDAGKRLKIVDDFEKKNAEERFLAIEEKKKTHLLHLSKTYDENNKKWEDEIFDNIIVQKLT